MPLHPVDLTVLLAYLLAAAILGVWVAGRKLDLQGYLVGQRQLPWWAILGSIVATETSTATFLSVPGLAYRTGGDMRFLQLAMGFVVGRIIIVWLLLPLFFRGQLLTAYQVLAERFGGWTMSLASIVFLLARNLGDGLRLFLTAVVLEKVVGLTLPQCVGVIAVVTIVYTFLGGIKAVVWNDCVQFVLYMTGAMVAAWVIVDRLPAGTDQIWEFAQAEHKLRVVRLDWDWFDPHTLWAGLFGGMFLTLGTHGTDQMMVQRYLCARSRRDAAWAVVGSGLIVLVQFAFFLLLGIALACYFATFPPAHPIATGDHALPTFVVDELPQGVGLVGLVLAAVFAAAMSTLSSSLNSSAASAVQDLYRPWIRPEATERHLMWTTRWMTIVFGVLQVTIAIWAHGWSESVVTEALTIAGFSAGLLLGIFLLGTLVARAGQGAALVGFAAGLIAVCFVRWGVVYAFGLPKPIAWPWYAVVGAVVTFSVGAVASLTRQAGRGGPPPPNSDPPETR